MLIKYDDINAFDFHGLAIRYYGSFADGAASLAVVDVPAHGRHPFAYSTRCDKCYYLLEGKLRISVDGVNYDPEAGDMVFIPKCQIFHYEDCWDAPSRLLLLHVPAFDPAAEHILPNLLREHTVRLHGERVVLRPMTEGDWSHLLPWNSDPEVLRWSDDIGYVRPEEDTKGIYRAVSLFGYNFIIEYHGEPIGECWLQRMNKPYFLARFPDRKLHRIDIMIGRKDLWGKGLGTDAVRTLVQFAFESEHADGLIGQIGKYNPRSRRAFEKAGFTDLEGYEDEEDWALVCWRAGVDPKG